MDFERWRRLRRVDWMEQQRTAMLTIRLRTTYDTSTSLVLLLLMVTSVTSVSTETVAIICRQRCHSSEVRYCQYGVGELTMSIGDTHYSALQPRTANFSREIQQFQLPFIMASAAFKLYRKLAIIAVFLVSVQ